MLSIVICHRNKDLLNTIQQNIAETVGVPYQLVVIDNTSNQYNIFSAYSEGVKRSEFDVICFVHEDIFCYTQGWGKKAVAHFDDSETGMIGIMGGFAQSVIPSGWWFNNHLGMSAGNLLMKDWKSKNDTLIHHYSNPLNDAVKTEVAIVDGLWFCVRKSLFAKISFDEKTYSGFHLYDADISMQVMQHAKNFIVYDVLFEHRWHGGINQEYYKGLELFRNKWIDKLPVLKGQLDAEYLKKYDWHALRSLILEMKLSKFSRKEVRDKLAQYYPIAMKLHNSRWFKNYFILSRLIGFSPANFIFFRLEKYTGYCKTWAFARKKYDTKTMI